MRVVYDDFQEKFYFLTKLFDSQADTENLRQNTTNLKLMYTNDLELDFVEECIHFQKHCMAGTGMENPSEKSLQGISKFLRSHSLEDVYPNLDIALRICLCIPATNCAGERSFSCLRRIKNYLRSSTSEDRLNSLAILCIESNITQKLSYEEVINEFAIKKSRRKVI